MVRTACTCRNPGLLPAPHSPFPLLGSRGSLNSLWREMNFDIFSYLGLEPPSEKILFFKTGHVSDLGMWHNRQNAAVSVIHQPLGMWTWSSVYELKSEVFAIGMKVQCVQGQKEREKGEGKLVRKRRPLILVPARCSPLPPGSLMVVHVDAAFQGPLCLGCRTCMVVPFSLIQGLSSAIPFYGWKVWIGRALGYHTAVYGCVQLCVKWKELSFLSIRLKQLTKRNRGQSDI